MLRQVFSIKIIILLIVTTLSNIVSAQNVNYELQEVNLAGANLIRPIPNANRFVVGHGWKISTLRSEGHLIRESALPQSFTNDKTDIDFVDSLNGYVFYSRTQNLPVPITVLYKTINGTQSWSEVDLDTNMCVYGFDFVNKDTGYVAGKIISSGHGVIRRTMDGGSTWQNIVVTTNGQISLLEAKENLLFYKSSYGLFYRSLDYGSNFAQFNSAQYLSQFNFVQDGLIFGFEYKNSWIPYLNNYIDYIVTYESHDDGASWLMRDTVFYANRITSFGQQNLFAWHNENSGIQRSMDAGNTWLQSDIVNQTFAYSFNELLVVHPDTLIISRGDAGILYNIAADTLWQIMGAYGSSQSVFFNEQEGIRFPRGGLGGVEGFPLNIYYTTDAGKKWTQTRSDYSYSTYITYFADIQRGANFVYGWTEVSSDGQASQLVRSIDKGRTWQNISIPFSNYHIQGLNVKSDLNVWVIGKAGLDIVLLHTVDGGITWQSIQTLSGYLYEPTGVYFQNNMNGFTYGFDNGGDGKILKTNDGGSTWNIVDAVHVFNANINFYNMNFINDTLGFINYSYLGNYSASSKKTNDGGNTWELLTPNIYSIVKRNDSLMYSYRQTTSNSLSIQKSYDNGITWQEVTNQDSPLDGNGSLIFVNDTTCYTNGVGSVFGKITFPRNLKPIARIDLQDSVFCINQVLNVNNISYYDSQQTWFINGLNVSNSANFNYTFPSPGTYQLKLRVANLDGVDSLVKNIYVTQGTFSSVSQSYTICPTSSASFVVNANGPGFMFQWQSRTSSTSFSNITDNINYSGTSNDTLNVRGIDYVVNANYFYFRCIVSGCGIDTSSTSYLQIKQPVSINSTISNSTNCLPAFSTATYSVQATGGGLTYQWQENQGVGFANVINTSGHFSGSNLPLFRVLNINSSMNGFLYRCIVSGDCPNDTSNSASIIAIPNATFSIGTQPINDSVLVGDTAMFFLNINPINVSAGYEWQFRPNASQSFQPVSNLNPSTVYYNGVANDTLRIKEALSMNNYQFRCKTWNTCNNATMYTDTVLLKINTLHQNVWPGDTDTNGIVDNNDLLQIGLNFQNGGPARTNPTNNWVAQYCDIWTNNSGTQILNKHADCDGNGYVYYDDTLALYQNFGLMHAMRLKAYHQKAYTIGDIYFVQPIQSYGPNQWVNIDVYLGSNTLPIYNFYGVAFTLDYSNNNILQTNTLTFSPDDSWIGANYWETIGFSKTITNSQKIYAAITRKDHNNVSGYGKIGTLKFKTINNSSILGNFSVTANNAYYIDNAATQTPLTSATYTVNINTAVGLQNQTSNSNISIYPNPNNGSFTLSNLNTREEYNLEVKDILGRTVYTDVVKSNSSKANVKLNQAAGVYWLQISSKQGVMEVHKVVVE